MFNCEFQYFDGASATFEGIRRIVVQKPNCNETFGEERILYAQFNLSCFQMCLYSDTTNCAVSLENCRFIKITKV